MSRHTPGPWDTTTRQGSWDWVVYQKADPNIEICQMFHDGTDLNEMGEANARLIAAAPDLLEALIDCSEALALARDKLGMCGEGDGKDRKADAEDTIGSLSAFIAGRNAIAKAVGK
jgi:hypothetical protein